MNISKTERDINKCQKTDPQNMPILRLFTLLIMVCLHILVIWQEIRYLERSILRVFIFNQEKVSNFKRGCSYHLYFEKNFVWGFEKGAIKALFHNNGWEKYISKYRKWSSHTNSGPPQNHRKGGRIEFNFFLVFFLLKEWESHRPNSCETKVVKWGGGGLGFPPTKMIN